MSRRLIAIVCASLAGLAAGCQFDGYVPKGRHQPAAEEERNIADLSFLMPASGTLDCVNGRCRVRHRLQVAQPGHVDITVEGPRGSAESNRPRLARAMLQDVNGRVIARNDVEQSEGAMAFDADVEPGPYFVLIQGLGGELEYVVTATYAPDAESAHAQTGASPGAAGAGSGTASDTADAAAPGTDAPAGGGRVLQPGHRAVRGAMAHAPGDTSDGADFAYDPTADLLQMRSYAFAENPQSQLDGEQSEGRGNPFVIRRIQREIRYALADVGVQQVEAEAADFLVSVQVGSKATTWYSLGSTPRTTSYDAYFDRWRGMGAFINPHTYVDGTLVIDFIDPKSGDLVWHGWTTEPVNVKVDDEKMLAGAVRAVLSQIVEE